MDSIRKPIYHFETLSSTGIYEIPVGRIIAVEDINGKSKLFLKITNDFISVNSTIQDFIDSDDSRPVSGVELNDLYPEFLSKSNTDPYSPSSVYHPATKGYVDSMASSAGGNVEITKGYEFTGNGSTTTFDCGRDDAYISGSVDVYHNGWQLNSTDYTAADGRNFTLTNLVPAVGDVIKLVAYGGADVYNKSQSDSLFLKLSGGSILGELTTLETKDTVSEVTTSLLDPSTGMIKYKILSGSVIFTESIQEGQVMLLQLTNGGSYTVTWPEITWCLKDAAAPELSTNDTVILFRINGTLYGTHSGNA